MTVFEIGGTVAIGVVTALAAGVLFVEYQHGRMSPMRGWTAATAPITALYCYLDASRSPWLESQFTQVTWAIGMWSLLGVVLILLETSRGGTKPAEVADEPEGPKPLTLSPIVPSLSNPAGDSGPHTPTH